MNFEKLKVGIDAITEGSCYTIQIEPTDHTKLAVGYAWSHKGREQALAYARLFAAAPEMLETLMAAYHYLEMVGVDNTGEAGEILKEQITNVLNKAEGAA